tara:strand:+ start:667 stop:1242 length:576 start_codon:yes stop_codon:yes gene_type:complete
MSDLTITTAGVSETPVSGASKNNGTIIRVFPVLDNGTAYTANDVMWDSIEIPNIVRTKGGVSKITAFYMYNHFDGADPDIDLVFTQKQANLGTLNDVVGSGSLWTEALVKEAKLISTVHFDTGNNNSIDLINGKSYGGALATTTIWSPLANFLVQAEQDSTSIYFAGVDRSGGLDYGADDLEFVFHIEYLS